MKTRTFEEKKILNATDIQAANIQTECYHLPILKPCKSKFRKRKTDHHQKNPKILVQERNLCFNLPSRGQNSVKVAIIGVDQTFSFMVFF